MKKKELVIGLSCLILLVLIGVYVVSSYKWMKGVISDDNESLEGSFVVLMFDANNKPTKYWVLQNETLDMSKGLVSFDELDGQTIHLHGNVMIKEFDDDKQLETIKKDYGLK
ncbi:hypothetical protein GCM10008018_53920 [Paenibacillus marchantiophytorum]|uniref:DUF3221 domain-containing protein n=1 Tax=Paenibacillus marchantiophytorum TaxID=1619310 RepID=A0ABQ1F757_9BACL|nr:hypothetical protein [Paenibacillus marchantiophytorum]GGA00792.1 hypothetical protein GCM10008018_53920 [Paenibacillus marchantiophytorum]